MGISDYLHDLRAKIGHDLLLTPGVAAVILNEVEAQDDDSMDNAADLAPWCDCPVFRCGHRAELAPIFDEGRG